MHSLTHGCLHTTTDRAELVQQWSSHFHWGYRGGTLGTHTLLHHSVLKFLYQRLFIMSEQEQEHSQHQVSLKYTGLRIIVSLNWMAKLCVEHARILAMHQGYYMHRRLSITIFSSPYFQFVGMQWPEKKLENLKQGSYQSRIYLQKLKVEKSDSQSKFLSGLFVSQASKAFYQWWVN